jgi:hypothetical protein
MKFANFFSVLLISTGLAAQKSSLAPYRKYIEKDLGNWVSSFRNFNFSDFKKSETLVFENNSPGSFEDLDSFYTIYKPILTFSKDSTCFIDIYSYQLNLEKKGVNYLSMADIDQAISLCDLKAKYWNRIYFATTDGSWIDDAIFIPGNKFILVGIIKNNNNDNLPLILIGDIKKQTLDLYESNNSSCMQKATGYLDPKLRRIKISELNP